jgi:hypothetical protein
MFIVPPWLGTFTSGFFAGAPNKLKVVDLAGISSFFGSGFDFLSRGLEPNKLKVGDDLTACEGFCWEAGLDLGFVPPEPNKLIVPGRLGTSTSFLGGAALVPSPSNEIVGDFLTGAGAGFLVCFGAARKEKVGVGALFFAIEAGEGAGFFSDCLGAPKEEKGAGTAFFATGAGAGAALGFGEGGPKNENTGAGADLATGAGAGAGAVFFGFVAGEPKNEKIGAGADLATGFGAGAGFGATFFTGAGRGKSEKVGEAGFFGAGAGFGASFDGTNG